MATMMSDDLTIPVRRSTPLVITDDDLALPPGDTWATFAWPAWVPAATRAEIERFWAEPGRDPRQWRENARASYNGHPIFGQRVSVRERYSDVGPRTYVGRWVPAWGNMGRLVLDDGTSVAASTCWWSPINFCRDLGDEDDGAAERS